MRLMSLKNLKTLALLATAGIGLSLAAARPIAAGGRVIRSADADCERPTLCGHFCHALKLHRVYFKRACSQKYILMPNTKECPPAMPYTCPPAYGPSATGAFPYPTIGGYGTPPVNYGPTGVFIR